MGNRGTAGTSSRPLHHDTTGGAAHLRNSEAFAGAVQQGYGAIYLTALAIVRDPDIAQDVTQETYLRAWLKIESLRDANLIQPWLGRIVRNLAVQWMRTGQQRSRLLPLIPMEEIIVEPADPTSKDPRQVAGQTEQYSQLAEAVMALPEDLRQAVLLHYAEGMSPSDIARLNGEAPSTVTRRLDKAREQLRAQLESGLAAGLAVLKARPRNLQHTLGLVAAASALPATTRAQLLHLAADTPPAPLIDSVSSAASAASPGETSIMQNIIAKLGATKLMTTAAAIAILGGGVYAVNTMTGPSESSDLAAEATTSLQSNVGFESYGLNPPRASARNRTSSSTTANGIISRESTSPAGGRNKAPLAKRITALQNELVSTRPEYIRDDGITSGGTFLNLQVADGSGLPVKGATVRIWGLRYKEENISGSIGLPQDDATTSAIARYGKVVIPQTTNDAGIARVFIPEFVSGTYRTRGFNIQATHPEYTAAFADLDMTRVTKIIMTGGNTVEVQLVDQQTSQPIQSGVTPIFDTNFSPEWEQRSDGVIAIRKISGEHLPLYLTYTDSAGRTHLSAYQNIKLPHAGEEPINIPVVTGFAVRGRLSAAVPRPVINGTVQARSASGPMCSKYAWQEVPVAEDGSFQLTNMPPGEVLIAALADGYNSTEPANEKNYSPHAIPHRFKLETDQQEYELPMQARANLRLKVVDATGNPVSGVTVQVGSMLCFASCCDHWGGDYTAVSGADGIAVLTDIPSSQTSHVTIRNGWRIPQSKFKLFGAGPVSHQIKLTPGDQEDTVIVEPEPGK